MVLICLARSLMELIFDKSSMIKKHTFQMKSSQKNEVLI